MFEGDMGVACQERRVQLFNQTTMGYNLTNPLIEGRSASREALQGAVAVFGEMTPCVSKDVVARPEIHDSVAYSPDEERHRSERLGTVREKAKRVSVEALRTPLGCRVAFVSNADEGSCWGRGQRRSAFVLQAAGEGAISAK